MQTTGQSAGPVAVATATAAGDTVVLKGAAPVRRRVEVETGPASTIGAAHHAAVAVSRTSTLTGSGACRAAGGSQAATARAVPSKRSVMREVSPAMSRAARLSAGCACGRAVRVGVVVIASPRWVRVRSSGARARSWVRG
ncbi:hypothetical protein GCM10010345_74650 [Streptomyces canarius]|uniref:Uncharacterized protein n=1 Tax=Streptomyces canarius TaxID=285453 RepID=A0ABQ3DBE2_9ACTN|nr:hypothetical protein GCM10010345_74650 [Streptomyces canarius]